MEVDNAKPSGFPNFLRNTIVVAAAIGVAYLSNPAQPTYVKYAASQLSDRFDSFCQGIELPKFVESLTGNAQQACESVREGNDNLEIGGRAPIEAIVDRATTRKNFGVFSLYETQVLNGKITTIGVFGQFVTLPKN